MSNVAAAKSLEHEVASQSESERAAIVLEVDGHFSMMVNPKTPVTGTSIIVVYDPDNMGVLGFFVTNRPGDCRSSEVYLRSR